MIRLDLSTITPLLALMPNMKIVHLVRDPRATLLSQLRAGMCSEKIGGKQECTSRYCYRLENDILEHQAIARKYPGRISHVFYEQVARYPLEASNKMYNFVGMEYTNKTVQYVFNITMAGRKDNCGICTTRSNSSKHVDAWKTQMDKNFIGIVEDRCHYVLKYFDYEFTKLRKFKY